MIGATGAALVAAFVCGWGIGTCLTGGLTAPGKIAKYIFCRPVSRSCDPNEIFGPNGFDTARWIAPSELLPYIAHFENDSTLANAPAQRVTVSVDVDPDINPATLKIGTINFGTFTYTPPTEAASLFTTIDLEDSLGFNVEVTAGYNIVKKQFFWVLQTIDPASGLSPTDPNKGFLLVNDSLGRGKGYVSYTVKLRNTVQHHDTVKAQANIVFDINPPIVTNTWTNVIDSRVPSSQIGPLPSDTNVLTFPVPFTAQDDTSGSGLRETHLFVSDDGGMYMPFDTIASTDTIGAFFTGMYGHTYRFYSIAIDNVGNMEDTASAADATITIQDTVLDSSTVTVISPLEGDQFCAGSDVMLRAAGYQIPAVDIYLYRSSTNAWTLLDSNVSTVNDTLDYNVMGLGTGSYRLAVLETDNPDAADTSGMFTLRAPIEIFSTDSAFYCAGSTATLDAGHFASYQWGTSETTRTIDVTTTGWYGVMVTDSQACTASDSIYVLFDNLTVSLGADKTLCNAASTVLNAGSGYSSYLWSNGDTTATTTVSTSGTYHVTVGGGSCSASDTVMVTFNTASVSLGADIAACTGSTVTLDAGTGFSSYMWSNGDTTQTTEVSSGGNYSVMVATASGCTASDTVAVSFNSLTVDLGSDITACNSSSQMLDAGTGYTSYLWSTGDTTQTTTVSADGTYSVLVGNGTCTAADTIQVTFNTVMVSLGADLSLCAGDTATLDAGSGYAGYLWSNGATTQTIRVVGEGTYSVRVTGSAGCQAWDTVGVDYDTASVSLGPDFTLCSGSTVILDAGAGYSSYLWSTGATSRTITASAGSSYSVTVTTASGCTDADTISIGSGTGVITSNTIGSSQTICSGTAPAKLTGSAPSGGNGTFAYQWIESSNGGSTWSTISSATGSDYQPGTLTADMSYARIVTSGGGNCGTDTSAQVDITLGNAITSNSAGGNKTFCALNKVVLYGSAPAGGTGTYSYQWQRLVGGSWKSLSGATGQDLQVSTTNGSQQYRRLVTGGGCSGTSISDTATITVLSRPNNNRISANQAVCSGSVPATLVGREPVAGSGGPWNYVWQMSADSGQSWSTISGASSRDYSPGALTQYTMYRRIVQDVCDDTSNTVIIRVDQPIADNTIDTATVVCDGADAVLMGSRATGGRNPGTIKYTWQSSPTGTGNWSTISGQTGNNLKVAGLTQSTFYRRIATSGACSADTSNIGQLRPTGSPDADFDYTNSGLAYSFSDSSTVTEGSITKWTWNFGDGKGSSLQHPTHTYGSTGTYTVSLEVRSSSGCKTTKTKTIGVSSAPVFAGLPENSTVEVMPNPSSGAFSIRIVFGQPSEARFRIVDGLGHTLWIAQPQGEITRYEQAISLAELRAGVYFLETVSKTGTYLHKIVIE